MRRLLCSTFLFPTFLLACSSPSAGNGQEGTSPAHSPADTGGTTDGGGDSLSGGDGTSSTPGTGVSTATGAPGTGAAPAGTGAAPSSTGGSSTSTDPGCGNGIIEAGEACDGADLGGRDCDGLGFTGGGSLSCNGLCQYDSTQCIEGSNGGGLVTEEREFCSDTCWKPEYVADGRCFDGGPNSTFNTCEFGSDCTDCGSQTLEVPVVSGGGRAACGQATFGTEPGQPVEDWTTYNQHGAPVSLSDFCGKWIYIELGRMGCPVCRNHAPELEQMAVELKNFEDGLVVIDSLGANLNPIDPNPTDTPSVAELQEWAAEFGQVETHAVCDADYTIQARYWPFGPGLEHERALDWGHPRGMLINPDGVIVNLNQNSQSRIERMMSDFQ